MTAKRVLIYKWTYWMQQPVLINSVYKIFVLGHDKKTVNGFIKDWSILTMITLHLSFAI